MPLDCGQHKPARPSMPGRPTGHRSLGVGSITSSYHELRGCIDDQAREDWPGADGCFDQDAARPDSAGLAVAG
jgi:hypothetical protein